MAAIYIVMTLVVIAWLLLRSHTLDALQHATRGTWLEPLLEFLRMDG